MAVRSMLANRLASAPSLIIIALYCNAGAYAGDMSLALPLECDVGRTCYVQNYVDHDPSLGARDYSCGSLTYDGHNGTDFRLPTLAAQRQGVNVMAAADGRVLRLRNDMPDVSFRSPNAPTLKQRECGNGIVIEHGAGWETQYCHLAYQSIRVQSGKQVSAGQSIAQVGLSGKTEFPHLHFTLRRDGHIVDPFAYGAPKGACAAGSSLWKRSIHPSLIYQARTVLNTGFSPRSITMEDIESGAANGNNLSPESPALVAFVRAIGLRQGDAQRLVLRGPNGEVVADVSEQPLDRDKAQMMIFIGKKRHQPRWPPGLYDARYSITNRDVVVLERSFSISF